jgi:hypothetical protein
MGISELKTELKKLDKDMLIDLVTDLYKKNKSVKEFLDFYVNPDEKELFSKYRDRVYEAFFPRRGDRLRLAEGKKAISEFKKLGASKELLADLMLFYTETGVKCTNEYGDMDEPFYNSVASVYSNSLALMKKEKILDKFYARAKNIVDDTQGIGWGFYDELSSIYCEFYPED